MKTMDVAPVLLLIIGLAGLLKTYFDWFRFERKVRQNNFMDSKDATKTTIKIVKTSAITGLVMGLFGVVLELSSPVSVNEEDLSWIVNIGSVVFCTVGWSLFALIMFSTKVVTLRSIYKEKPPE